MHTIAHSALWVIFTCVGCQRTVAILLAICWPILNTENCRNVDIFITSLRQNTSVFGNRPLAGHFSWNISKSQHKNQKPNYKILKDKTGSGSGEFSQFMTLLHSWHSGGLPRQPPPNLTGKHEPFVLPPLKKSSTKIHFYPWLSLFSL